MDEYKYKVFISYCSEDKVYADFIYEKLKTYVPTKEILQEINITKKDWKKWNIFRDKYSLSSDEQLWEQLQNGLNNSEYLLVIVSKKFYQKNISEDSEAKHWGLREIKHFQKINSDKNNGNKMHHIITLLALKDGTEIITENNAKEYYLDELVISNNEEKIYPLSSTLYSPSKLLNRFNYLDDDFGKVLCPLLKCKMETITAFEKKRNHKIRVRQIFSIITLIILISSIIISIITFNNAQLHEKNIEIQQKNDEIEEQNQSLLIENSYHLINEADYLYKDGNIIEAVKTLISALPTKENPRPFITEVLSSISKYISPFEFYNIFYKEEIIHDKKVEYIPYFDENRLVSCAGDYILIWDCKKNSLIDKIHVKSDLFPSPYYLFSTNFDDNKIDNDFESLNFSDNDEDQLENHIWLSGSEKRVNLKKTNIKKYNHNSSFLYVEGYNNIAKIDCKTGEILWNSYNKPWCNDNNIFTVSGKNIVSYSYDYNNNNHYSISELNVINSENGEIAHTIDTVALQEYNNVHIKYIDPNFNYLLFSYDTVIGNMGVILNTMGYASIKNNKLIVDKVFLEHATVDIISIDYFSKNSNAIQFSVSDNILYIYDDHFKIFEGPNEYEHEIRSCQYKITAIDLNTFDVICEIEFNSSVITKSVIFNAEDTNNYCKIGCFITDKNVLLIDLENGFVLHEFNFEKNIVSSYSAKNGYLIINLADGSQKIIDASNISQGNSMYTVYNLTDYGILPYIVAYNGESSAIVSNNINGGKSVHIVKIEKNSDYNCILDYKSLNQNDTDSVLAINSQATYSVINSQVNGIQKLMIFDINNNKIISETEANVLKFLGFFDDTHIYYLTNDKELVIFNIIKGTSKKCYVSSDLSLLTFLSNNQRIYNKKILTIGTTYDRDANAKKYEVDAINYISNIQIPECLRDDMTLIRMNGNKITIFDTDGINIIKEIECPNYSANTIEIKLIDNTHIISIADNYYAYVIDITNGDIVSQIPLELYGQGSKLEVYNKVLILSYNQGAKNYSVIIDRESFKLMYTIQGYVGYDEKNERIYINNTIDSELGYFPFYSTEEIIDKAYDFINLQQSSH